MYSDSEVDLRLHKDRKTILDDIARLVSCESPSNDPDRLRSCSNLLIDLIRDRTGIQAETVTSGDLKIIIAKTKGHHDRKPITIVCHYDTVHPVGTLEHNPVGIRENQMTGPGIFDMKAGIVMSIWGLKYLIEMDAIDRDVSIIITFDEELESKASSDLLVRMCHDSAVTLVMEPSLGGRLKIGRKGVGSFTVTIRGIASHAGLDPDRGANAISELARLIPQIEAFQDRDLGTTVCVSMINGGAAINVVPDFAEASVDVRVKTMQEGRRIEEAFRSLCTADPRTSISVSGGINRPPMEADEKNLKAFELVRRIGSDIGMDLESCEVGGASDGNFISASGCPVVDGFGAVGDGAHALREFISIDQTLDRIRLLTAVLEKYP